MTTSSSSDLPSWSFGLFVWIAAASVAAYVAYRLDKRAAVRGRFRIPESRLHMLELVGGWPGAILAMRLHRHKIRKWSHLVITGAIVIGWLIAIGLILFG